MIFSPPFVGGEDEEDDESGGMGGFSKVEETHPTVSPRWPTRVFASESVQRIMTVCEKKRAHFDLALARELKRDTGKGMYVYHVLSLENNKTINDSCCTLNHNALRS